MNKNDPALDGLDQKELETFLTAGAYGYLHKLNSKRLQFLEELREILVDLQILPEYSHTLDINSIQKTTEEMYTQIAYDGDAYMKNRGEILDLDFTDDDLRNSYNAFLSRNPTDAAEKHRHLDIAQALGIPIYTIRYSTESALGAEILKQVDKFEIDNAYEIYRETN